MPPFRRGKLGVGDKCDARLDHSLVHLWGSVKRYAPESRRVGVQFGQLGGVCVQRDAGKPGRKETDHIQTPAMLGHGHQQGGVGGKKILHDGDDGLFGFRHGRLMGTVRRVDDGKTRGHVPYGITPVDGSSLMVIPGIEQRSFPDAHEEPDAADAVTGSSPVERNGLEPVLLRVDEQRLSGIKRELGERWGCGDHRALESMGAEEWDGSAVVGVGVGEEQGIQMGDRFQREVRKASPVPFSRIQEEGDAIAFDEKTIAAMLTASAADLQDHASSPFATQRLRRSSAVVVNSVQINAMAMPVETLPCSNSRMMNVETTSVLGGAIRLAHTSSLNAMMKVIIQPLAMDFFSIGRVMRRNTYIRDPPETAPASSRWLPIWDRALCTYWTT